MVERWISNLCWRWQVQMDTVGVCVTLSISILSLLDGGRRKGRNEFIRSDAKMMMSDHRPLEPWPVVRDP